MTVPTNRITAIALLGIAIFASTAWTRGASRSHSNSSKTMSKLLQWLKTACYALGIQLDVGYSLNLSNGKLLSALARVRNVGAPNGMLIVRSYEEVKNDLEHLREMGYGFSVLDEPLPDEEFDLETFREIFLDWGWSATASEKPAWWS